MRNAIITYAQGNDFVETLDSEIFLKNLNKHKTFKKFCFTKDLNQKNLNLLNKYFDDVFVCENPIYNSARDRFMSYYLWMIENYNNFDKIMHLDFRDIVIQKDPFEFMNQNSDKDIFVVSEGMKIKDNYWNKMDMNYFNKTQIQFHKDDFSDYYVINGGTIGGNIFPLSQLFLLLWVNSNRNSQSNTDQATLNYLYPYLKCNPRIMVCHPLEDTFCATGEGIKYGNVPVKYNDTFVANQNNENYYIFHQWDRTEVADKIRQKQKETLSFMI